MIVVDANLSKKIGSSPDAIFTSFISLEICDNLSEQDHINHCNQNRSSLAWFWCITEDSGMTRSKKNVALMHVSWRETPCMALILSMLIWDAERILDFRCHTCVCLPESNRAVGRRCGDRDRGWREMVPEEPHLWHSCYTRFFSNWIGQLNLLPFFFASQDWAE